MMLSSMSMAQPTEQTTNTMLHNPLLSGGGGGLGPSTATSPGMLIPSVRAMIDAEHTHRLAQQQQQQQQQDGDEDGVMSLVLPKLELEGLTAGAIADLVNVTRELRARNVDGGDFAGDGTSNANQGGGGGGGEREEKEEDEEEVDQYYVPLRPFSLPVSAIPPRIEPGRVDIRLHALHSKLGKI